MAWAPFIERFFDLARAGTRARTAGFIGMIVANSFMKREFGKKLIEDVLPHLDLTHVIDCSGAYIPGHGTPTVILFRSTGRRSAPKYGGDGHSRRAGYARGSSARVGVDGHPRTGR